MKKKRSATVRPPSSSSRNSSGASPGGSEKKAKKKSKKSRSMSLSPGVRASPNDGKLKKTQSMWGGSRTSPPKKDDDDKSSSSKPKKLKSFRKSKSSSMSPLPSPVGENGAPHPPAPLSSGKKKKSERKMKKMASFAERRASLQAASSSDVVSQFGAKTAKGRDKEEKPSKSSKKKKSSISKEKATKPKPEEKPSKSKKKKIVSAPAANTDDAGENGDDLVAIEEENEVVANNETSAPAQGEAKDGGGGDEKKSMPTPPPLPAAAMAPMPAAFAVPATAGAAVPPPLPAAAASSAAPAVVPTPSPNDFTASRRDPSGVSMDEQLNALEKLWKLRNQTPPSEPSPPAFMQTGYAKFLDSSPTAREQPMPSPDLALELQRRTMMSTPPAPLATTNTARALQLSLQATREPNAAPPRNATSTDPSIMMQGHLIKQGQHRHSWKRRWFVLRKAQLRYFKHRPEGDDAKPRPQGMIALSTVVGVEANVELYRERFCFQLITAERVYAFQCQSKASMRLWMQKIRGAVALGGHSRIGRRHTATAKAKTARRGGGKAKNGAALKGAKATAKPPFVPPSMSPTHRRAVSSTAVVSVPTRGTAVVTARPLAALRRSCTAQETRRMRQWINSMLVAPAGAGRFEPAVRNLRSECRNGLLMCLVMNTLVREKAAREAAWRHRHGKPPLDQNATVGVKPPFAKPLARGSCLANINCALMAAFSAATVSAASMPKALPIWEGAPRAAARFFVLVFESLVARQVYARAEITKTNPHPRSRGETTLRWVGTILARYGRSLSPATMTAPHVGIAADLRDGVALACLLHYFGGVVGNEQTGLPAVDLSLFYGAPSTEAEIQSNAEQLFVLFAQLPTPQFWRSAAHWLDTPDPILALIQLDLIRQHLRGRESGLRTVSDATGCPGGVLLAVNGATELRIANVTFRGGELLSQAPVHIADDKLESKTVESGIDELKMLSVSSALESEFARNPLPRPSAPLPVVAGDGQLVRRSETTTASSAQQPSSSSPSSSSSSSSLRTAARVAALRGDDGNGSAVATADMVSAGAVGAFGSSLDEADDLDWEKKQEQLEDAFQHHLDVLERMQQHAATIRAQEAAEDARRAEEEAALKAMERVAAERREQQRREAEMAAQEVALAQAEEERAQRAELEAKRREEEVAALEAEVERMHKIEQRRLELLEEKRSLGEALHAHTLAHGLRHSSPIQVENHVPASHSPQQEMMMREEER